jgi:hypothetical protein
MKEVKEQKKKIYRAKGQRVDKRQTEKEPDHLNSTAQLDPLLAPGSSPPHISAILASSILVLEP